MLQAILDIVLSPAHPGTSTEPYDDRRTTTDAILGGELDSQIWFDQDLDMDFWMNLEDHPLLLEPDALQIGGGISLAKVD